MTYVDVKVMAEEAIAATERALFATSPTNMAAVLATEVVELLQQRAETRFDNEASERGAWAELTESTQAYRDAAGFPPDHPINIRTGELFGLMTTDRGAIRATASTSNLEWPFTNDALIYEKLRVAQEGNADPYTPARPVLELTAEDAAAIVELFQVNITELMAGAGIPSTVRRTL